MKKKYAKNSNQPSMSSPQKFRKLYRGLKKYLDERDLNQENDTDAAKTQVSPLKTENLILSFINKSFPTLLAQCFRFYNLMPSPTVHLYKAILAYLYTHGLLSEVNCALIFERARVTHGSLFMQRINFENLKAMVASLTQKSLSLTPAIATIYFVNTPEALIHIEALLFSLSEYDLLSPQLYKILSGKHKEQVIVLLTTQFPELITVADIEELFYTGKKSTIKPAQKLKRFIQDERWLKVQEKIKHYLENLLEDAVKNVLRSLASFIENESFLYDDFVILINTWAKQYVSIYYLDPLTELAQYPESKRIIYDLAEQDYLPDELKYRELPIFSFIERHKLYLTDDNYAEAIALIERYRVSHCTHYPALCRALDILPPGSLVNLSQFIGILFEVECIPLMMALLEQLYVMGALNDIPATDVTFIIKYSQYYLKHSQSLFLFCLCKQLNLSADQQTQLLWNQSTSGDRAPRYVFEGEFLAHNQSEFYLIKIAAFLLKYQYPIDTVLLKYPHLTEIPHEVYDYLTHNEKNLPASEFTVFLKEFLNLSSKWGVLSQIRGDLPNVRPSNNRSQLALLSNCEYLKEQLEDKATKGILNSLSSYLATPPSLSPSKSTRYILAFCTLRDTIQHKYPDSAKPLKKQKQQTLDDLLAFIKKILYQGESHEQIILTWAKQFTAFSEVHQCKLRCNPFIILNAEDKKKKSLFRRPKVQSSVQVILNFIGTEVTNDELKKLMNEYDQPLFPTTLDIPQAPSSSPRHYSSPDFTFFQQPATPQTLEPPKAVRLYTTHDNYLRTSRSGSTLNLFAPKPLGISISTPNIKITPP